MDEVRNALHVKAVAQVAIELVLEASLRGGALFNTTNQQIEDVKIILQCTYQITKETGSQILLMTITNSQVKIIELKVLAKLLCLKRKVITNEIMV